MTSNAMFAQVAALAGDPARAAMLHALLDGGALTASDLAGVAGVAPQTASGHLARMTEGGLTTVQKQGRHRYYRLASPAVAQMMESIMQVASGHGPARGRLSIGPRDAALRAARVCFDHLAGALGVAITDALVDRGYLELGSDAGIVTAPGMKFLAGVGVDVDTLAARRGKAGRVLCRPCLDWSARRPHLAGAVGAALCARSLDKDWIRRIAGSRAVAITSKGQRIFREQFGVRLG
jgi:DNA-binding transcriptional ArsR family regulator